MPNSKYYMLEDGPETADLYIFGDITSWGHWDDNDPDRSAYNIVTELQAIKANNITVHINSYGGEVAEGLAIYNTLKNSGKKIKTICDGFACSAASVVFMAGIEREMNSSSLLMVHNAWTWATGNAEQLRKTADDMDKITQASIEAYKATGNISEEKIKELMDNETWITPEEALDYGFATKIVGSDDGNGAQQSVRKMIFSQLAKEPKKEPEAAAAKPILEKEPEPEKPEEKEPEAPVTPEEPKNSWNMFFN